VSRLLVLVPLVLWLFWAENPDTRRGAIEPEKLLLFAGGFVALVVLIAAWARLAIRDRDGYALHRRVGRFHHGLLLARVLLLVWFGVGLFALTWGDAMGRIGRAISLPIELPLLLVATAPVYLAWCAIAWAQYPAERAWREHNLMLRYDDDRPLYAPPSLRQHLSQSIRLQLLFTLVPVLAVVLVRDLLQLAIWNFLPLERASVQIALSLVSVGLVFLVAPELLRRVLPTSSLPPGPLRDRLERFCRRVGLRHRDVLVWHTHCTMSNAAVMGVVPRFRYVLLSDLLIETLTPRQVESVFAHEVGHVKHHHMLWYLLFVVGAVTLLDGPGTAVAHALDRALPSAWFSGEWVVAAVGMASIILVFGMLSRRCERQADAYAARSLLSEPGEPRVPGFGYGGGVGGEWPGAGVPETTPAGAGVEDPRDRPVEPFGAEVFAGTLRRVAEVNGIAIVPRPRTGRPIRDAVLRSLELTGHFLHGGIAERMNFVRDLASDPARTAAFDRFMRVVFFGVLVLLVAGIAFAVFR
jgi:STE24 endopeptidase